MNTRRALAIGVLQIGHPLGIDATASAQLEQNRECPCTWYQRYPVARFDKPHLANVAGCSDSGDGGGNHDRRSGVDDWLVVTSNSVPVAVVFGHHLESLGLSIRQTG